MKGASARPLSTNSDKAALPPVRPMTVIAALRPDGGVVHAGAVVDDARIVPDWMRSKAAAERRLRLRRHGGGAPLAKS